jgi:hypothetical protein
MALCGTEARMYSRHGAVSGNDLHNAHYLINTVEEKAIL